MSTEKSELPLVELTEAAIEGVCVGQVAALAALRAEIAALSTMMAGLSHHKPAAAYHGNPGERPVDVDPEDNGFDNMPV